MNAKWIQKTTRKINHNGEFDEQCKVIEWANKNIGKYPCLKYLHASLNGVRLTIGQAMKAKRGGLKKGVPDLFLPFPRKGFHGLYIEMKYGDNKLSPEQKEWREYLFVCMYEHSTCWTAQAAINEIENYLS